MLGGVPSGYNGAINLTGGEMPVFKAVMKARLLAAIEVRNVYYAETTSDYTGPNQDIVDDLKDWMVALWAPLAADFTNQFHAYEVEVYQWVSLGGVGWQPIGASSLNLTGTSSGDPLPPQVAAVAIAKTAIKRTFARKFLAGFVENTQAAGTLAAGVVTELAAYTVIWLVPFTGEATTKVFTPGLWTKNHVFEPFVSVLASAILGTMRRRKVGVGI